MYLLNEFFKSKKINNIIIKNKKINFLPMKYYVYIGNKKHCSFLMRKLKLLENYPLTFISIEELFEYIKNNGNIKNYYNKLYFLKSPIGTRGENVICYKGESLFKKKIDK